MKSFVGNQLMPVQNHVDTLKKILISHSFFRKFQEQEFRTPLSTKTPFYPVDPALHAP